MQSQNRSSADIQLIGRAFYAFSLLVLVVAYYNHELLHQLQNPVLIFPSADNTSWLFHLAGLPQLLVAHYSISLLFDITLFSSALLSLIYLDKKVFPICFLVLLCCYFITYNSYLAHHSHSLIGLLMMSTIFCVKSEKTFAELFGLLRYYVLFIFVSAALWKIFRGSVFSADQMFEILKQQHLYQLLDYPSGNYTWFIYYLIDHKILAQLLFIIGCMLQLSFFVGFFTRRFDKVLLVLFFVFFLGDYLFMGLGFYELYILSITLLPWPAIKAISMERS